AHMTFGGKVVDVAVAAVHLQSAVTDSPRRFGGEELGHRRFAREWFALELELSRAQAKESSCVELGAAVGKEPLDGLKIGDGAIELAPVLRVASSFVERG